MANVPVAVAMWLDVKVCIDNVSRNLTANIGNAI